MDTTELVLIRHGQSEANVGLSKEPDCGLSELGLRQARELAARLARWDFRGFEGVVSPYRRAVATAAEIKLETEITFEVDEGVREWGPVAVVKGREYPPEPVEALVERLKDFLRRKNGRRVVVVAHAAPIALLTQLAWGEMPVTTGEFWTGVNNCCPRWLKVTCG